MSKSSPFRSFMRVSGRCKGKVSCVKKKKNGKKKLNGADACGFNVRYTCNGSLLTFVCTNTVLVAQTQGVGPRRVGHEAQGVG